jgi:DNA polymerase-3 subunit epsilon
MTWDDLKGQPKFADIAAEFADFARDAQWVIHNAPFDLAFLDKELARAELPRCADVHADVIDTLALAREMFPGKRNGLDALCERFGIDNAHRSLHGALLDAQLLAEVYLAMTRGQETLTIEIGGPALDTSGFGMSGAGDPSGAFVRPLLRVIVPSPDEIDAHRDYLAALQKESRGRCVWLALEAATSEPTAVAA